MGASRMPCGSPHAVIRLKLGLGLGLGLGVGLELGVRTKVSC